MPQAIELEIAERAGKFVATCQFHAQKISERLESIIFRPDSPLAQINPLGATVRGVQEKISGSAVLEWTNTTLAESLENDKRFTAKEIKQLEAATGQDFKTLFIVGEALMTCEEQIGSVAIYAKVDRNPQSEPVFYIGMGDILIGNSHTLGQLNGELGLA